MSKLMYLIILVALYGAFDIPGVVIGTLIMVMINTMRI